MRAAKAFEEPDDLSRPARRAWDVVVLQEAEHGRVGRFGSQVVRADLMHVVRVHHAVRGSSAHTSLSLSRSLSLSLGSSKRGPKTAERSSPPPPGLSRERDRKARGGGSGARDIVYIPAIGDFAAHERERERAETPPAHRARAHASFEPILSRRVWGRAERRLVMASQIRT